MRLAQTVLICAGAAVTLRGGTMVVTYSASGVQQPSVSALCAGTTACYVGMENFDTDTSWTGGAFTSNFPMQSGSTLTDGLIQGSYTGSLTKSAYNEYGGAGGTGDYVTVSNSAYTLTLTNYSSDIPGVDYFGLWFSALDSGNELQFYSDNTLLYTFGAQSFISLVGACPAGSFCGNPNADENGKDSSEQFAFLNFFYQGGYFNKIVFTETTSAGFESDNQTVAYLNPPTPSGTVIDGAPEPGSMSLLALGAAVVIGLRRRSTSI